MASAPFSPSDPLNNFPVGRETMVPEDIAKRRNELSSEINAKVPVAQEGLKNDYAYNPEKQRENLARTIQNPAQLFESFSPNEVSDWLETSWKTFDFEPFMLETEEEKSVFTQSVASALYKISIFLQQAQQSPDFSNPQTKDFNIQLYDQMTENVTAIWEEEMSNVFSGETISLEEVFAGLLDSQMRFAALNSNEQSALRDEHFANGGTEEGWNKKVDQYLLEGYRRHDENDKETQQVLQSVSSREVGLPDPSDSYDSYLKKGKKWVVNGLNEGGRFSFLKEGINEKGKERASEPFVEVIAFVQSGGQGKLSPKAYKAMTAIIEDGGRAEQRKKWVENKITKVKNKYTQYNNVAEKGPKKDAKKKKYEDAQGSIFRSDKMYQLVMQDFAKDAKTLMGENHENFVSGENPKEYIEFLKSQTHKDGYSVKNIHTDSADSRLSAQISGRFTGENLLLDQVVRSGALIMVITNILIGFRTGKWASVAPYILGGTGAMWALKEGVINSGIGKLREPDKMLNNIVQESSNNRNYPEYFSNPWEIALANAIQWPDSSNKKSMKNDLKAVKKNQDKDTIVNRDGTERKTTFMDRKIVKKFEENIHANSFNSGCDLEKYLPQSSIPGPDGVMMPKDEFLKQVQKNGVHGSIRYEMLSNMTNRIGKKDSYLPYLNQLHEHYTQKDITQELSKLKKQTLTK